MSLRLLAKRLVHNARVLCHIWGGTRAKTNILEGVLPRKILPQESVNKSAGSAPRLLQVQAHARRIFIDNVLNRVTNSLTAELSRKAAKQLLYGNSRPFLTLVGVSLASGSGLLTREDEFEGVCWEIRDAVSKLRMNSTKHLSQEELELPESLSIKDLDIGNTIAKGCNAVVYSARLKKTVEKENDIESDSNYPWAVKMVFNYYAESNASSILKAMFRETVPARRIAVETENPMHQSMASRRKALPAHPNIVEMPLVFADQIPLLPDSFSMYPSALPPRLNPESGIGRNMSLFLLMKRYDSSLRDYLISKEPSPRVRILLLAQLLEGIAHLFRHHIAHRDLKSDNLLLDLSEGESCCPLLVISDFGCCLSDNQFGLRLPFSSHEIDRGGNIALMAPEVATATPGTFTSIDYSKADLWAAATLSYEIFGDSNPFGSGKKLRSFDYKDSDIPPPPDTMPQLFRHMVLNLLHRNPSKRLNAEIAANVCQVYLWGPSTWLRGEKPSSTEIVQWLLCLTTKVLCENRPVGVAVNSPVRVSSTSRRRTLPEYQLIAAFLSRACVRGVRQALNWIHSVDSTLYLHIN